MKLKNLINQNRDVIWLSGMSFPVFEKILELSPKGSQIILTIEVIDLIRISPELEL
jgi:hypothetical protein